MTARPLHVIAAGLLLFAAGCLTDTDAGGTESGQALQSYDEMAADYRSIAAAYDRDLPNGMSFPDEPPEPEEPTLYQPGNAQIYVDGYWICAWKRAWLDEFRDNSSAASEAMEHLRSATETVYMRQYLEPPGTEIWNMILSEAELGDPANLQEHFTSSCTGWEF